LVQGLGIPVLKQHLAPLAHQHLPSPFSGQGYRVQGYGFRVQGSGLRVRPASTCHHQRPTVHSPGFRIPGFGRGIACQTLVWQSRLSKTDLDATCSADLQAAQFESYITKDTPYISPSTHCIDSSGARNLPRRFRSCRAFHVREQISAAYEVV